MILKAGPEPIIWALDSLNTVGGNPVELLGSPRVIQTEDGEAVQFDGLDDALRLGVNPLAGMEQFTVEVVFRPEAGGEREQRFLHFQQAAEHRVLIETRLTEDGQWFLDTFMKAEDSERTLFAKDHLHSLDEWHHAALTYDGKRM
ncbi:MAG: LamG domain-containing protein, partial [Acidobacteriota bacterium]